MTTKIDLVLSGGNVFVWNAADWLKLRKEYRIIGKLVGCLPKHPRQELLLGLPLLLSPEEATLLLEKQVARIIEYPCMQQMPSESLKAAFNEYREKLFIEQEECLREQRKKQLINVMDKIVEGKRRKVLGINTSKKKMRKSISTETREILDNINIDTEALLKNEMEKIPKLDKSEALVQTHLAYPWSQETDVKVANWNYPSTSAETFRYQVFKDIWQKGFYITSGEKFGGDFLAYPGDPIMFHSQFIIQCKNKKEAIPIMELIGQCRVGCHVRKTFVLASYSEDEQEIKYQSFQWAESSMLDDA